MDAVCLSLLFLFCCQKPPKNFFSCLHVERKKKGRQYRTHFNSSTGKVIHCTAYLWMFSCIYIHSDVFLLVLTQSALISALQQKMGKAQ